MTSRAHLAGDWIDPSGLPASAMFDTGILIPAFVRDARATEDRASRPLWEEMVRANKRVMIAAPSAAELFRRHTSSVIPRTRTVKVEVFDPPAADILGKNFPPEVLVEYRNRLKVPLHYIKYDAMIVACAVRHRASVLITTDAGQINLSAKVGLSTRAPREYLSRQPRLPHV